MSVKDFLERNRKWVTIAISAFLAVCFLGSVLIAIFIGGEFAPKQDEVNGLMRISGDCYASTYFAGDKFSFDKSEAEVMLIANDPLIEELVRIENLPGDHYGFRVNGKGKIFEEAEDITMTADVEMISVVSKVYPSITVDLPMNVIKMVGNDALNTNLTLEAEEANLYQGGVLVTDQEKTTAPSAEKPFLSSAGTPAGEDCSGGACLRSFEKLNMKVEFTFLCTQETEVSLEVLLCQRTSSGLFGSWYLLSLNGKQITGLDSVSVPAGSGYFTPYTMPAITIKLSRGLNVITFESGAALSRNNPANLDAIRITAPDAVIAAYEA